MLDFSRYLKLDCLSSPDNPRQDTIKGVSLPRHFPRCLCNWTFIMEARLYLAGPFPPQMYPYLLGGEKEGGGGRLPCRPLLGWKHPLGQMLKSREIADKIDSCAE